jgi:phage terminase small subunit
MSRGSAHALDKQRKLLNFEYLKPPTDMPEDQKEIWDKVVHVMPAGFYVKCDVYILTAFCKCQLLIKKAEEHLVRDGCVIVDAKGVPRTSPWINILAVQNTLLLRLCEKLRITTSIRVESSGGAIKAAMQKAGMGNKKEEEEVDPREGLI